MTAEQEHVIDSFVRKFHSEREKYQAICDRAEQKLTELCGQKGIMAKVNGRVKDSERLREKLYKRVLVEGKSYADHHQIREDISDLVGLRIALYFPSDVWKIKEMLKPHFDEVGTKKFPLRIKEYDDYAAKGFTAHQRRIYPGYEHRKFDGYCAMHYHVRLAVPVTDLDPEPVIEIQVASLLMHAWSEVEHDLAYKKKMGEVSREEYECLDEINGLVMAGEIALNRLNQLSQRRIRDVREFDNHFTLAAYLSEWQKDHDLGGKYLGNVETLFKSYASDGFLGREQVDRELQEVLKQIRPDSDPLADLLLDQFSRKDHRNTVKKMVSEAITQINDREEGLITAGQLGNFMGRWNALEDKARSALRRRGYLGLNAGDIRRLVENEGVLSPEIGQRFRDLRIERNKIVHGYKIPGQSEFRRIMADMEALRRALEDGQQPER